MPAAGFTPILTYASSTPGNVPAAANLNNTSGGSELAINIADGKLYYKDSSGVVQVLATKSAAAQQFSAIVVTGGSINGTPIGATTPSTGAFSSLSSTGTTSLGATSAVSINSTPIGATTPSTGAFTSLTASGTATLNTLQSSGATITGGSINGTPIGGTTPSTGSFAGLTATGTISLAGGTTTVAASSSGTAQPVPRNQADTLYAQVGGNAAQTFIASNGVSGNEVVNISQFVSTLGSAGSFTFPGGMIIKWGTVTPTSPNTIQTFSFPVAFPNNAYLFMCSSYNGGVGTYCNGYIVSTSQYGVSTSASGIAVAWLAIGD